MNEKYIGYKIRLFPTEEQAKRLIEICHVFRFCYNWGLNYANTEYEKGNKNPSYFDYIYAFNDFRNDEKNKWIKDFPLATCRYAFKNVAGAFEHFFAKRCKYPKFKSRKKGDMKFHVRESRLYFYGENNHLVAIEGMGRKNYIECKNHNIPIGKESKYSNCYVHFDGDNFWLSFNIKMYDPIVFEPKGEPLGIDLGVRNMITLSNGKQYKSPDISKLQKRRSRIDKRMVADVNRRFSISKNTKTKYEDIPKSSNQLKREKSYRKCCRKIANIYDTYIHQVTHEISLMDAEFIVLEDLKIKDILKYEPYMSKILDNARFYTIRKRLEYKCRSFGTKIIIAPQTFPSSQICSNCGNRKNIGSEKIYKCPVCGAVIDRDINASINLLNYGRTII